MTKRDSLTANLPSSRDLRMASEQDVDATMEPVSSYTAVIPAAPMPPSDPSSTLDILPTFPLDLHFDLMNIANTQFTQLPSRSMSTATEIRIWWWKKPTALAT